MAVYIGQSVIAEFGRIAQPVNGTDRIMLLPNFLDTSHVYSGAAQENTNIETDTYALFGNDSNLRFLWYWGDAGTNPEFLPLALYYNIAEFHNLVKLYIGFTVVYGTVGTARIRSVSPLQGTREPQPALHRQRNYLERVEFLVTLDSSLSGTRPPQPLSGPNDYRSYNQPIYILTNPGGTDSDGFTQPNVEGAKMDITVESDSTELNGRVTAFLTTPPLPDMPVLQQDSLGNLQLAWRSGEIGRDFVTLEITGDITGFLTHGKCKFDNRIWTIQDAEQINPTQWEITVYSEYYSRP